MYKGKLIFLGRIKDDTTKPLRTDVVEGEAVVLPRVGWNFIVTADPLDSTMEVRIITTSTVTAVNGNTFTTTNSRYRWEPGLIRDK